MNNLFTSSVLYFLLKGVLWESSFGMICLVTYSLKMSSFDLLNQDLTAAAVDS